MPFGAEMIDCMTTTDCSYRNSSYEFVIRIRKYSKSVYLSVTATTFWLWWKAFQNTGSSFLRLSGLLFQVVGFAHVNPILLRSIL